MSGFFGRMTRKWWLMLVVGIVIGLVIGLIIGRLLPENFFGTIIV